MERSEVLQPGRSALVSLTATALFLLAIVPCLLRAHGGAFAALVIGAFFSKLCHQRPDRVLYLLGSPTAICLRCLGLYAGAAVGSLLRLKDGLALRLLVIALSINAMDVAAESIGLHGNMPLSRLLLGAALGAAVGATLSSDVAPRGTSLRGPLR